MIVFGTLSVSRAQQCLLSVSLRPSNDKQADKACYDLRIRSNQDIYLGSQNYRIYYDASQMRYLRDQSYSLLEGRTNSALKTNQLVHNANAFGYGNLEYSQTLGFVNLSIPFESGDGGLIKLKADGWVSSARLCFELSADTAHPAIVWGRPELTAGYSSAFTEISVIVNGLPVAAIISDYEDLQSEIRDREKTVLTSNNQ